MPDSIPVAVQLYTLRTECEQDLLATLDGVAAAGYRWLEWFGGSFGVEWSEIAAALRDLGLRVLSAHVPLERLETDVEQAAAELAELDCRELICPWLSEERRAGDGAYEAVGAVLARAGSRLAERGCHLSYHNHDFELSEVKGTDGIRRLLAAVPAAHLSLELDVYWLAYAGADPAATILELAPRVRFLHLKDGTLERIGFAPLGRGDVDLPATVAAGLEIGVRGLIVEQDYCDGPPLDALRESLAYLEQLPQLAGRLDAG